MDILYITAEIVINMETLCSRNLIDKVFNDFRRNAVIQERERTQYPSRVWVISDYISDDTVDIIDRMSVILSFVVSGGIVQLAERSYFDIFNLIASIKQRNLINDEQLEIIYEPWYQFYYRKVIPHFD